MINLLPPAHATRIRFGRRNTVLRLWIFEALAAVGGLIIILACGWLYLNQQQNQLQATLDTTSSTLQAKNLAKVQKDAATITGDIKVITQVLSNEVKFSLLMQDIGKIMPPGAVLSSLSLVKVDGGVDLSVNSKDYNSAAQVAINLNDPANGIFSKVDIVNISCTNKGIYVCSGKFRALFNATAKKKYLGVAGGLGG